MTAVRPRDVEAVLRSRPAGIDFLLVYGPDAGLVTERAGRAAAAAVADPADAFQLIRLDGDAVADRPGRLVEEATTIGLFGGSRAIWVRPTGRDLAPAAAACLDAPLQDTLVVLEAGDLKKTSPLRKLCEAARRALALPCYLDEGRDLGALVDERLAAEGLTIDRDARALLVESLGGDRLATRGELEKLALYCGRGARVTPADVEASVSDVSNVRVDGALDAAFAGDARALDGEIAALEAAGIAPAQTLAMALRHAFALLACHREAGAAPVPRHLPPARVEALGRQLRLWSGGRLTAAIRLLQDATLETRRTASLDAALTERALRGIARLAASRG